MERLKLVSAEYILADSSVWIRHFRATELRLVRLLDENRVIMHPLILLELSLGSIPQRETTLRDLGAFKLINEVPYDELTSFIQNNQLYSTGLGAVDVSLLAASLASNTELWSYDKSLAREWKRLSK